MLRRLIDLDGGHQELLTTFEVVVFGAWGADASAEVRLVGALHLTAAVGWVHLITSLN